MTDRNHFFSLRTALTLSAALALLAGCAAPVPAPIRHGTTPAADQTVRQEVHVVRPGDTLMGISRLYGQNVNDLVVWNGLINPNQLTVGQEVRIAPPRAVEPAEQVAIARPIEISPVTPDATILAVPIKHDPKGGRQPYSDQAWAAVRPATALPSLPSAPAAAPAPVDSAWLWPAPGPLIARFDEATNKGVDIAGNPGDPVLASAAGQVVYSGSGLRGYGKLIIIKHDENYLSAYAHNQTLLVKEGDTVTQGQRIAEIGSTDADRPKLHFEIRRQGRPVDPLTYLPPR